MPTDSTNRILHSSSPAVSRPDVAPSPDSPRCDFAACTRRETLTFAAFAAAVWLEQRAVGALETGSAKAKNSKSIVAKPTAAKPPTKKPEPAKAPNNEPFSLEPNTTEGQIRQVHATVASTGELKLNADGQKVTRRAVQVDATFRFDEITSAGETTNTDTAAPLRIRNYDEAQANIRVGATRFTSELKESRRLTAIHSDGEQLVLFSPSGPFTRDELDLLDVPGTVSRLDELLPTKPVSVEDRWTWSPETLARLLRLEAVQDSQVEARLTEVDKSLALIEAQGHVSGAVGGVVTEIEIAAKLNFDLDQRVVSWLVLGIKESRAIGHAEPGFETTTQIKVTTHIVDRSEPLGPTKLAATSLDYAPGSSLLLYDSSKGHFRLLLDRRWRTMVDREDLTVLRFVDRGDLVAQCNASPLPFLAPGKQLSLEEFQDDIKQSLTKTFRQFAEASQSTTEEGLRVLRVVAVGESAGLAVQWNYYHISNDAGRRLALVFTFESALYDRFAETDRSVVSSVQFLSLPEPTKAKTARKS